jgi:abortive infection bacteriophage resistance protein
MPYAKPYLALPDQLNLIKSRGLHVADDAAAIDCLHRNGYYRLSAYWYPFCTIVPGKRTDVFMPGSSFEDVVNLYRFDKGLKLLLLDALEQVEIAGRVEIALTLGRRDTFAHENPRMFHPYFTSPRGTSGRSSYDDWLDKFNEQANRSKDEFVQHYERQYGSRSPLPIWIAIELWDFGLLSRAYSGLQNRDLIAIATRFGVPDWRLMVSWLRCLNYVRNVIAHHGRLWNLNLSENPKLPTRRGIIGDFDALVPLMNVGT